MKFKNLTWDTILTRAMVAVLMAFMLTALLRFGVQQIFIDKLGMDNAFVQLVWFDGNETLQPAAAAKASTGGINWAQLYPFAKAAPVGVPKVETPTTLEKSIGRFQSLVTSAENKISKYTTGLLVFYDKFVEYANAYDQFLGWEIAKIDGYNNIITMPGGYLTGYATFMDVGPYVESVRNFKNYLDTKGINFAYVHAPFKVCKEDRGINGILDFSNQNADSLLAGLREWGIDYLDLRAVLHGEGLDHHGLFYKTDHHWKAETGLWAAGKLSQYLNEEYAYPIDTSLFDADRYTFKVYKDWFFGSQGKKVTLTRSSPEDISLIYPNFDVNLSLQIPSRKLDLTGDFNIIYYYKAVDGIDYYKKNPYAAYLYSDNPLCLLTNNAAADNKSILIIGDSFDNSLVPFLALGVKQVTALDLRHFTGSVHSLIEQNNFDTVIILYNPSSFNKIDLKSHKSSFDFR